MTSFLDGRIEILQGDITHLRVDAIVNAANAALCGGGGVDGAIHRAAGPRLLEACRQLRGAKTGEAKLTLGYELPARYVIHAVGPVWQGGGQGEESLLASCYERSLQLAREAGLESVAFPSISTGAYRFPFEAAAQIALKTVQSWLEESDLPRRVVFSCFSEPDRAVYEKLARRHFVMEAGGGG
jgi:O-acetyl-ADP-ribose deacetylase (regulator of RNase III)